MGINLWEDLALVEVVDEHNQPALPGTPGHRVLLTNLVNRTQPLIRYEISDLVTLANGPNPTGMPFRRITGNRGPQRRYRAPARPRRRHRRRAPASPAGPGGCHAGPAEYQIVHDQAGLHIAAVLREGAPTDTLQRVQAAIHCALLDTGAAPPPITVTAADSIPREPGPAAKLKTVKVNDPH